MSVKWNFRDFSVKYDAENFVVVKGIYLEPLVRGTWTTLDFPLHPDYRRHFLEQIYRRSVSERRKRSRGGGSSGESSSGSSPYHTHLACLRALTKTWPYVHVHVSDEIGHEIAREMCDLLTEDNSVDIKYAALNVMLQLLCPGNSLASSPPSSSPSSSTSSSEHSSEQPASPTSRDSDLLASIATEFAAEGGVDACCHMLAIACVRKTDYADHLSSSDNTVQNWMYRHSPGSPPVGPVSVGTLRDLLAARVVTFDTETCCDDEKVWRRLGRSTALDRRHQTLSHFDVSFLHSYG